MMCDRCVAALTGALHAFDGVARVEADLVARTVRVGSRHYESALLRTLREAEFLAEPVLRPPGKQIVMQARAHHRRRLPCALFP